MSKRARITLTPESAAEPQPTQEPEPPKEPEPPQARDPSPDAATSTHSRFTAADDSRPDQPAPAGMALNTRTIVKVVVTGLVVVSMLLLWKNRRP